MRTLIVTCHPDPESLTHQAASQLQELIGADVADLAHLAQEDFDPRFTVEDRQAYLGLGDVDPSITAEQQRLNGVTDLVLVFPVYWWSMPAQLKGWIDRVFVAGWAFDIDSGGKIVPLLGSMTMHLLPVSGTAPESFARHGYAESFSTQIEHGIVDYCGMQRGMKAFIYDSESTDRAATKTSLEQATSTIASAITTRCPS